MNTRNQDFRETVSTFLGKAKRLAGKIRHDFEVEFGRGSHRKHVKHHRKPSKLKEGARAVGDTIETTAGEIHKMGDKVEHAAD